MEPSEVEVECALSGDQLDRLIVEFVPIFAIFYVIEIMSRLCTGALMNQNCIKFINIFLARSCPFTKIQFLFVVKWSQDLDIFTLLKAVLESFQLDH